jgi:hypothetical protein
MVNGGQIKIIGSNNPSAALIPFSSKDSYSCANAQITKGITSPPSSLTNCFNRFPSIKNIADAIGVSSGNFWIGPGHSGLNGACGGYFTTTSGVTLIDAYLENPSNECISVANTPELGRDWLGCLWGSPEASFSCICPEVGPKFDAYLKLRQNVATFWNTLKSTPVARQEFLDALQFGTKVEITTAGDFSYKVGTVVYINVTGVSKNPNKETFSVLNGKYWISGIKHVITNSGTHESRLLLTQFAIDSPY